MSNRGAAKPYIVRKTGQVVHRATGRLLGSVAKHLALGGALDGLWSAWCPFSSSAIGVPCSTMAEAAEMLMAPDEVRPVVPRRMCKECKTTLRWVAGTAPDAGPCADCETQEQADVRSRTESPAMWEHYDWLVEVSRG